MRFVVLVVLCGLAGGIAAAQPARPDSTTFSQAQASRGQQAFSAHCSVCHTETQAAQLFSERSANQTLGDYYTRLSSLMPPQSTVKPSPQDYLDIIARLASVNGAQFGAADAVYADAAWRRLPSSVAAARQAPTAAVLKAPTMEWTAYRGDTRGRAYAAADQINAGNVKRLKVVWRWSGANFGPTAEVHNVTTPLMVGGVLYATSGNARNVVAIDAATGETLWMWRPQEAPARLDAAPRKGAGRGVSYWTDGKSARIFTVTPGFHLAALDAKTGRPVGGFGVGGVIDLQKGLRGLPKTGMADVGSQSPPLVLGDVVVVGPAAAVSRRPRGGNVKGDVRGFDARTGKLLWTFRTIPQAGDAGYETWAKGTAETTGNGGAWAPISGDPETGAVFVPVEAGTSDYYGGQRIGANAHTSSLVSLDSWTGRIRWERQLVHHDVWDFDVPAIPILADIPMPGGVRKAVLQVTKESFVFAFDRNTGEPLWPIEERPVPKSDVPGEVMSPTQPYPTLPKPIDRQGFHPEDLIDLTPAIKAAALEAARPYRFSDLFTPVPLKDAPDGTHGVLRLPNSLGGANWEGGAYDPETGMLYVGSMSVVELMALAPSPEASDIRYWYAGARTPDALGLPLVKPPWGRITAIDMTTGLHAWMIANADTPKAVRDNPALKGVTLPRTGIPSRAGLLATKTLLFAGEGDGGSPVLRAHDKASGAILAEIPLPASQMGLPMSYVWAGKQYIVMSVGDGRGPAEIVALALP
ncbi:glucose/quinate/shikimate family membrane-bound PQQ-dependent dehydrogenase [soil metagenome]